MTGHRPWETLLERLSPERREAIAKGAAKMRVDIERRRQALRQPRRDTAAPPRGRPAPTAEDARTTS